MSIPVIFVSPLGTGCCMVTSAPPGISSLECSVDLPQWAAHPPQSTQGCCPLWAMLAASGVLPPSSSEPIESEMIVQWRHPPIFVTLLFARGISHACHHGTLGLHQSRGGGMIAWVNSAIMVVSVGIGAFMVVVCSHDDGD